MQIAQSDIKALAVMIAKEIEANMLLSASPGRWLTIKEAMAYAKVKSEDTIRRWINEGCIYAHKRSGHWIVDRESIDDWFSSGKGY